MVREFPLGDIAAGSLHKNLAVFKSVQSSRSSAAGLHARLRPAWRFRRRSTFLPRPKGRERLPALTPKPRI